MLTAAQGYYDGNTVIFDEKPSVLSGRVIVTFLQDKPQEKSMQKISDFFASVGAKDSDKMLSALEDCSKIEAANEW